MLLKMISVFALCAFPRALFVEAKYSRDEEKVDINNNATRVPFLQHTKYRLVNRDLRSKIHKSSRSHLSLSLNARRFFYSFLFVGMRAGEHERFG